ncbi:protein phosphatase 1D-like [Lethenteron reissneri]|uniref:protein phosphatase 1D-like n=1 Tax=Lethenteron reissneri TaxID=7753 RepID=UPI002AB724C9|nr:protein phosphatase 1D-like [Lethenteron reissneri]
MSSPWKLIVSVDSNRGGRRYMEDVTQVSTEDGVGGKVVFLAVFDGHGGSEAAEFARRSLWPTIRAQPGLWGPPDPERVCSAIRDGFLACQRAMWGQLGSWRRTWQGEPSMAGTTACCCLLMGDLLFVAHVGDSRAVLAQRPHGGRSATATATRTPSSLRPIFTMGPSSAKGPPSMGPPSMGPPSMGPPSMGPPSMGPPSTGPPSTGPPSTGPPSKGPSSTGPPSTGPPSTGPPSMGPPFNGPPFNGPPFNGSPFNGPPFKGPPFNGPPFNGPPFNGPPFNGPPFNGSPFKGPLCQGDLWSYEAARCQFVVSPEPDVSAYRLEPQRHRHLVLATDGVWDVLMPTEAVRCWWPRRCLAGTGSAARPTT